MVFLVYLFERRDLLPAIRSPCSPEIEKDDLSPMILQGHHFTLKVFQRKTRRAHRLGIGMKNALSCRVLSQRQLRNPHPEDARANEESHEFQSWLPGNPHFLRSFLLRASLRLFTYNTGCPSQQAFSLNFRCLYCSPIKRERKLLQT